MKSFFDLVNELSMKSDKKLPNLKLPVKGKKGTSKFMRMKVHSQPYSSDYKKAMNAGFKTDANRKAAFAKMNDSVHSADKKPEKYRKPDGKIGIRMVPIDKEVIKKESVGKTAGDKSYYHLQRAKELAKKDGHDYDKLPKYDRAKPHQDHYHDKAKNEASVLKPTKPTDIIKHAKTLAKNPRDYMMNKKKYLDKARAKVFRMYPKEAINHDDAHRDAQTHSDGSMSVKKIPSMIKKPGDKHLHLHMKSYHKEKDGQDFAKKHGYKVKNYVKTPSGTRMDIHKESIDEASMSPMNLKRAEKFMGPSKNFNQAVNLVSKGMKVSRLEAMKMVKKILGVNPKTNKIESVDEAIKNLSSADQVKAALKIIRDKRFNMRSQIDKKTSIQKISKDLLKDPKVKKEMDKIYEETVDEALTLQQRMKRGRLMKRLKARIKIGRDRARRKMANKKTLEKRAMRQARNQIAKKLTRGIPKRELTFARKQEIEKRLDKPALKSRIQ